MRRNERLTLVGSGWRHAAVRLTKAYVTVLGCGTSDVNDICVRMRVSANEVRIRAINRIRPRLECTAPSPSRFGGGITTPDPYS